MVAAFLFSYYISYFTYNHDRLPHQASCQTMCAVTGAAWTYLAGNSPMRTRGCGMLASTRPAAMCSCHAAASSSPRPSAPHHPVSTYSLFQQHNAQQIITVFRANLTSVFTSLLVHSMLILSQFPIAACYYHYIDISEE